MQESVTYKALVLMDATRLKMPKSKLTYSFFYRSVYDTPSPPSTRNYGNYHGSYPDKSYAKPHSLLLVRKWKPTTDIIQNIKDNLDKYHWDWREVTLHNFLHINAMLENPDIPWDYSAFIRRPDFSIDLVKTYPSVPWSWWNLLNSFGNDVIKIIRENPELLWNWSNILNDIPAVEHIWENIVPLIPANILINPVKPSRHLRNIPWKVIEKYPNIPWDFTEVSYNDQVSAEVVDRFPDKPWDWNILTKRFGKNYKLIARHADKPWDWQRISGNRDLNWYLVFAFPDKPWAKKVLSCRLDISLRHVSLHPQVWNFRKLTKNPLITPEFVQTYWKLPWRGRYSDIRRSVAAKIIQKWWLRLYYNPYTNVGKRRLLREFEELTK
jgi:hypothetical protein